MFDRFLADRPEREQQDHRPFSAEDYYLYADGKPRYDGVESCVAAQGTSHPRGDAGDPTPAESAGGVGARKDALFDHFRIA